MFSGSPLVCMVLLETVTYRLSSMGGSENVMSFGQIVPIFLLSSTVFVFREAYEGQCPLSEGLHQYANNVLDQMNVLSKKDTPQNHTSQTSLVNSERSSAIFSIDNEQYEMSGAPVYPEDEQEPQPGFCRRADTEAGGRLQVTGHEAGRPSQVALRRFTFPQS